MRFIKFLVTSSEGNPNRHKLHSSGSGIWSYPGGHQRWTWLSTLTPLKLTLHHPSPTGVASSSIDLCVKIEMNTSVISAYDWCICTQIYIYICIDEIRWILWNLWMAMLWFTSTMMYTGTTLQFIMKVKGMDWIDVLMEARSHETTPKPRLSMHSSLVYWWSNLLEETSLPHVPAWCLLKIRSSTVCFAWVPMIWMNEDRMTGMASSWAAK